MKKAEPILLIIAAISIIANLLLVKGSGTLLIVSLSGLSIYYFLAAKVWSKEALSSIDSFKKRLTGWGFSLMSIGVLFTLMIWPNSRVFLILGLISVLFATFFRFKTPAGEAPVDNSLRTKSVIFILIGVTCLLIPKRTWIEHKFKDYPDYVNAWEQAQNDPRNPELRKKVADEYQEMMEQKKNTE
jgi:hypothetical protein